LDYAGEIPYLLFYRHISTGRIDSSTELVKISGITGQNPATASRGEDGTQQHEAN
jgi:hypothetical protein